MFCMLLKILNFSCGTVIIELTLRIVTASVDRSLSFLLRTASPDLHDGVHMVATAAAICIIGEYYLHAQAL